MVDREEVKVETCDTHDRVIRVLLILHGDTGSCVPDIGEVVVARTERFHEGRAS